MTPGQQVSFQHSFQRVLAEHFNHAAVGGEFAALLIFRKRFGNPELFADFRDSGAFAVDA